MNAPNETQRIRPWQENARYWQYKGRPVLLLGGSREDNLFQIPDVEEQLDTLVAAGGNYIRNTMSDRDPGDHRAFARTPNGKHDLTRWNPEYWGRFARLLELTAKRDIVVQIEIWDRFDHSTQPWQSDPYNPANNVNYSFEQSGFEPDYPEHPGKNKQPFFKTPPTMEDNTVVLPFQQAFVRKLLSHSLPYGHVLYCIDNEYGGSEAWSDYWADFLHAEARNAGCAVEVTEMFDHDFQKMEYVIDHPERYTYVEGNKIMAPQKWAAHGEEQWHRTRRMLERMNANPRPFTMDKMRGTSNNVKGDHVSISRGKFWRGLLAGYSAVRFHRPVPGSLGISREAQNCIRAARKLESAIPLWELEPRLDLLRERRADSAYLCAKTGDAYALYMPAGGTAVLDLAEAPGPYALRWIDTGSGEWGAESMIEGATFTRIAAPDTGHWVAAILKDTRPSP
ncbi:MAG: hypothetical protein JXR37_26940 [Kiritimatiellae bacterium]|nr:hypothetical protein [Kiritimatiellia bacterium]